MHALVECTSEWIGDGVWGFEVGLRLRFSATVCSANVFFFPPRGSRKMRTAIAKAQCNANRTPEYIKNCDRFRS